MKLLKIDFETGRIEVELNKEDLEKYNLYEGKEIRIITD